MNTQTNNQAQNLAQTLNKMSQEHFDKLYIAVMAERVNRKFNEIIARKEARRES